MTKNGFTQIPNEIMEAIIKTKTIPLSIRIIFWYLRNMFGWNKNFKSGFFLIKSFKNIAENIFEVDRAVFKRTLIKLSEYGFFSIDFKEKIFYLYAQKSVDQLVNKKTEKALTKKSTERRLKSQHGVDQLVNTKGLKSLRSPLRSPENTSADETLKHSLKKELNKSTTTGDVDVKFITELMRKSKWFNKHTYLQVSSLIFRYGEDAFIYSVNQMNKMERIPCRAIQYIVGILKKYNPEDEKFVKQDPDFIKREPEPEDDEELDPIWGMFEPYKKFFPECKTRAEVEKHFNITIKPVILAEHKGWTMRPDENWDKFFEVYEGLR